MRVKAAFIILLWTIVAGAHAQDSSRPDPVVYLQSEQARILLKARLISDQLAKRQQEQLDQQEAHQRQPASSAPPTVGEPRLAVVEPEKEANRYLPSTKRDVPTIQELEKEVARLRTLAQEVDPRAQKDLLDRIRACCQSAAVDLARQEIIRIARSLGSDYTPSTH